MSRLVLIALAGACLMPLTGCITENARSGEAVVSPWPEEGAPDELRALAEDLAACQATAGRMPDSLTVLDRSGVATGGPYASHGYAYHPAGIGILHDGWRVVAADDRIRSAKRVWCVVRPPVRVSGSPVMRVVLVPMIELREAAAAAGGG